MGVARIGRTRARPGSPENGAGAHRRLETPEQGSPEWGHKVVGVSVAAIIAVGYLVAWMRALLFGP
jgi:hypothetical protein